jgi:hypothetical protein
MRNTISIFTILPPLLPQILLPVPVNIHPIHLPKDIHRHASRKTTHRNDTPNLHHVTRAFLSSEVVDESTEGVEEEVLNHHLEDENLGAIAAECITVIASALVVSSHMGRVEWRLTGYKDRQKSKQQLCQSTQRRSRTNTSTRDHA